MRKIAIIPVSTLIPESSNQATLDKIRKYFPPVVQLKGKGIGNLLSISLSGSADYVYAEYKADTKFNLTHRDFTDMQEHPYNLSGIKVNTPGVFN